MRLVFQSPLYLFHIKISKFLLRDADDAVHDLDGKDLMGGRVRVELAKAPRDQNRGRFGGRDDRGSDRYDRGGDRRRGNPPGPRTKYRIIVENVASRTSWQVKKVS